MKNTSATPNGLPALELAAAITEKQWSDLERFADVRLRRSARSPQRQRALAVFSGRVLIHMAVEQFALGDLGLPGGRKLTPKQRVGGDAFLNALRGAINSLITHALDRVEFAHEHVAVDAMESAQRVHEPSDPASLPLLLELRDLERRLFAQLEAATRNDPRRQLAVKSLRADCVTGHVRGQAGQGLNSSVMNEVRELAQEIWQELNFD